MSYSGKVIESLVPISQFNKGMASKIFDRLKFEKYLFVLKNNKTSAVILSPDEYERLSEMEEDLVLMSEAVERLSHFNTENCCTHEEVLKDLGITQEEIDRMEDVEID